MTLKPIAVSQSINLMDLKTISGFFLVDLMISFYELGGNRNSNGRLSCLQILVEHYFVFLEFVLVQIRILFP